MTQFDLNFLKFKNLGCYTPTLPVTKSLEAIVVGSRPNPRKTTDKKYNPTLSLLVTHVVRLSKKQIFGSSFSVSFRMRRFVYA